MIEDIPRAVADIASRGVDFLYVGSSSFLLAKPLTPSTCIRHS